MVNHYASKNVGINNNNNNNKPTRLLCFKRILCTLVSSSSYVLDTEQAFCTEMDSEFHTKFQQSQIITNFDTRMYVHNHETSQRCQFCNSLLVNYISHKTHGHIYELYPYKDLTNFIKCRYHAEG
jgi:hypothetical protein